MLDIKGREIERCKLDWGATGGFIDALGEFKAGLNEGNFAVWATCGKVKGSCSITILAASRPLKKIVVSPQDVHIGSSKTQAFTAKGFDAEDKEVPIGKFIGAHLVAV